jgi:hypothetical protein
MSRTYQIADEPQPSTYARYAVSTHWPLLAQLLGGSWIGLPWFIFNGRAVGSATRNEELRAAIFSLVASLLFAFVAFGVIDAAGIHPTESAERVADTLGLPDRTYAYAWVVIIAIKVWFAYRINWLQAKSLAIHESYGGKLLSGAAIVAGSFVARSFVLGAAAKVSVYLLVVVL